MYLARLNTPNFEFLTFGDTREDAFEMMRKAWNKHQKQTGADWDWNFVSEDVAVDFVRIGDTFRNRELWFSGTTTPTN
jgi:hypothetical protein